MRKLSLTVIGLYLGILAAFSQTSTTDTGFKSRKLTFDEANFISSYYTQNGNNAAVTGGIGSEKLNDISNSIEIKLHNWDRKKRKHTYDLELGVDHYTSASSDMIDLKANSSASHADTRVYPSANWTMENEQKGSSIGAGGSISKEFDYLSFGGNINFSKKTKNRSGEFSGKLFTYLDNLKLVYPVELRSGSFIPREENYPTAARNTFGTSLSYSQIISQRLQIAFLLDMVYQDGYLGLPFHRVYFTDNSVHVENLPGKRLKIPIGFRANYFLGDHLILRGFYRYYHDDWGLNAHTFNLETAVKITPFVSVTPFYRYYTQTAIDYFAAYGKHVAADTYYSSNYDLSTFNSHFFGAGIRLIPPDGVFKLEHLNMLELRYGHYSKTNGMNSDVISLNLKLK
ncbi:MAG: DUF3570 domain-containing protein [Bacteroidota bacterium]|nr:DUF3570 domain-containing protein [Bacteroidota bacterium]